MSLYMMKCSVHTGRSMCVYCIFNVLSIFGILVKLKADFHTVDNKVFVFLYITWQKIHSIYLTLAILYFTIGVVT